MFASKDLFFSKPSGGYQISRSVRLRSSASAYFNRTAGTATNQSIATWSFWFKRGTLGTTQRLFEGWTASSDSGNAQFEITTSDVFAIGGYTTNWLITTQVFRDPSAWYHIVVAFDTTQATASNRIKLYVNGSQVTVFGTAAYPTQNTTFGLNNNSSALQIGRRRINSVSDSFYDGYFTEINMVDGQQLTPSSFGQTNSVTGVWQPIKYAGTYGTNGFYLNFSDNSNNTATTIGKDNSGNGNNWTPNNISVTAGVTYDSMLDVPTPYADGGNGRGNYCVASPISMAGSTATISNGNLSFTNASASHARRASTIAVSSGKWYAEATITTVGGSYPLVGIATTSTFNGATYVGADSTSYGYASNATKYNNAGAVSYGATYTTNDVIGIALDLDAGTLVFYKNNVSQGTAYSSLSGEFSFAASGLSGTVWELNFGQRPFSYTPPSGFVALNTQNLPTPTISNGANYMAATLWTGNGTSQTISNTVNGISFQPDLVWAKSRSATYNHLWVDVLRGTSNYLFSNNTAADTTSSTTVTSFNSNGFSIGTDVGINNNTSTFVGWQWKANGAGVSNTSGSITSTVSAGATQGFSVVTYTGTGANATVGHGLGVAPKMVIVKTRSGVNDWAVYHTSIGATKFLLLDTTAAAGTSSAVWNNTAPTSSVFSIATDFSVNQSTATYVAYCFAEVAGYSKFGSYTGNGSTDGPFAYLGFRPRFIIIKDSTSVRNWYMYDTTRSPYNLVVNELYPNLSNAESTNTIGQDILSNGFKVRSSDAAWNANGNTYIYAAFAENPFKNSLAR